MRGKCLEKNWGARILNFKESYKKDYEEIKTDEAFRNRLSEEINSVTVPAKQRRIQAGVCAAAAVIAIAAGLRFFTSAEEQSGIIHEQVGTATTLSAAAGVFTQEKWYAEAETDEEIWDKFRELIGGGDITSLYCGNSEQLGDGDILSAEEAEALSRKLSEALPCGEKELNGNISFCMAVFGDGNIIKFRISESGEVQLNDAEIIYKFK